MANSVSMAGHEYSRRSFLVTSLSVGFALAVRPVRGGIRITIRNEQDDERLLQSL